MEFDSNTEKKPNVRPEGDSDGSPRPPREEGEKRNRNRRRRRGNRRPDGQKPTADSEAVAQAEEQLPVSAEQTASEDDAPREEGEKRSRNRRRRNRNRNRNRTAETVSDAVTEEEEMASDEMPEEETIEELPLIEETMPEEEPESETPAAAETKRPMYLVVGVRFRPSGKVYYFDPGEVTYPQDTHVIVETARGEEFGVVSMANRMVPGTDVVLPLRGVVRVATPEDERRHEDNLEKETEAYNLCLSRIEAHRLDMKLVDVEYAFDNSKLLFYFTAEGRVDFRELVKDLASVFRTRIELRQIGIRDEAKLMGGLGVCGRPFCCKSFLPDFVQVSIKMAKEQNLSLNSAKISGACGRLMCCLRYEYETYLEESALTPKVDAIVNTPDGEGVVIESSPLKGTVKVVLNKEPNGSRLYRREDLAVIGSMKGKRKPAAPKTAETPKEPAKGNKKNEEKA